MVERVFDRVKHYRRAATRHDRLDETFLPNLQLILIAIYLKKHSQKRLPEMIFRQPFDLRVYCVPRFKPRCCGVRPNRQRR